VKKYIDHVPQRVVPVDSYQRLKVLPLQLLQTEGEEESRENKDLDVKRQLQNSTIIPAATLAQKLQAPVSREKNAHSKKTRESFAL